MTEFTQRVIQIINEIPEGRVMSYGEIARRAGNNRASRAVVFILRSRTHIDQLPWHRVVDRLGNIKIKDDEGFQLQKHLLESEKVIVDSNGKVNMGTYGY